MELRGSARGSAGSGALEGPSRESPSSAPRGQHRGAERAEANHRPAGLEVRGQLCTPGAIRVGTQRGGDFSIVPDKFSFLN